MPPKENMEGIIQQYSGEELLRRLPVKHLLLQRQKTSTISNVYSLYFQWLKKVIVLHTSPCDSEKDALHFLGNALQRVFITRDVSLPDKIESLVYIERPPSRYIHDTEDVHICSSQ